MAQHIIENVRMLAEIVEMKRMCSIIDNALKKKNPACIVVTSGSPGEGKTTVAAGLSVVTATLKKKRVLAVDLNWYAPGLHEWFGIDMAFDVDRFRHNGSITEMVQPSGIDNLDVLTAPKPSEAREVSGGGEYLLGSEIIKKARDAYDFVVVDTSSIFPINRRMIDPVTLSSVVDGVALVVLTNVTPRERVKRARMFLETSGAKVLGVVVNQWQNPIVN